MALTVGIHQPNFMPWLGWFDKIDRADVFVLLDSVQLERRSPTTRVSLLQNGRPLRLTVPVRHVGSEDLSIRDAEIDVASPLLGKMRRCVYEWYRKSPFWKKYGEPILDILRCDHTKLLDLNLSLLRFLAHALEIDWSKVRMQSNLPFRGRKSELNASLTRSVGGDTYVSGGHDPALAGNTGKTGRASDYTDPLVYAAHGVVLTYQNFVHPEYDQECGSFVRGLTALDALVRLGPDTMDLVRHVNGRGHRSPRPAPERSHERRT
jgi:hypothetical protein